MTSEADLASVAALSLRMRTIPALLDIAARLPLPVWSGPSPRRVVTTGIGASEGPARLLASVLLEHGICSSFVPLAAFAWGKPEGELLVVFSQNLSPNARLALTTAHRFATRWLITSVGLEAGDPQREQFLSELCSQGVIPIVAPPAHEDGMLVRVVGPTVAALVALRLAKALGARSLTELPFEAASAAYVDPVDMQALDGSPVALIAAGLSIEALHGQRWKLLETLLRGDPPVWDALQVAHGPLQSFHEQPMCLLALATAAGLPLLDRLEAILTPGRHRLIRIVSTRSDALSYFEHAAAIDACILATLRAHPRNLFDWPGRGADGAIYRYGEGVR